MFTNLLFLILALLAIDLAPSKLIPWPKNDFLAGTSVCLAAIVVFILIYVQNRAARKMHKKHWTLLAAQIELIAFLLFALYVVGVGRWYLKIPFLSQFITGFNLLLMTIYLSGLGFYYATTPIRSTQLIQGKHYAWLQIRFLLPFLIPFILYQFILDILLVVPSVDFHQTIVRVLNGDNTIEGDILLAIASLTFLTLLMIFLPYFIQLLWKCVPLTNHALQQRLEQLCMRAHFAHAGLKVWTIMRYNLTAAIIGIIPRFRYVMFTESLLKEFPDHEIEAILAHEIGHSYHKHLIIYPIIFGGMLVIGAISTEFVIGFDSTIAIFICFAGLFIIYFRFIFGFFSRLFERQADLYVFKINVPAYALIEALNRIGIATGNTHDQPSWHHGSIRQRMEFLKAAIENPSLIKKHGIKVKAALYCYFFLLILAVICLFYFRQ